MLGVALRALTGGHAQPADYAAHPPPRPPPHRPPPPPPRRAAYEAAGTHGAVRDTVVDDLALAQAYVRAGKDIFLVHAEEFMTTRMYGSLREIVAGWSKNLASGVPRMMPPIRVVRALVPYLMWLPSLFWILPPIAWAVHWPFGALARLVALAPGLARC